jgi:phthiocerol/phenolphthiocerol synthesis type-I polyketide synthase E
MTNNHNSLRPDLEVAVIGMAGRFPGAGSLDEFWRNLCDGVESISTFTDEQLASFGISPSTYKNPDFVKAAPVLDGIDEFDAEFFGYSPREARLMDPQHRLFLECAWAALESAGYPPGHCPALTGVYAGSSLSSYLLYNILPSLRDPHAEDTFQAMIGNDKDFLCTRVSYKLNLQGPSITVQTGCSTSLVAIHLACQGLLGYQCDLALAGGVSVQVPARTGYLYQSGGLSSPDGHCRAFDAKAEGTLFGSGVGTVVLKRLSDALADRDCIHAVIKGSAINNDGNLKVGYTAPSVAGQISVIRSAHAMAATGPETIGYVECHGTGTALGDPIEIQALKDAFIGCAPDNGICAVGSVKTNIGHLDAAAGVAGFLKAVLALKHKALPPSLHFESPNPRIEFENGPFRVNSRLSPWETAGAPRRAGVSSFGIGGTNAHIVLQESPITVAGAQPSREHKLLVLSARTRAALEQQTINLAQHLKTRDDLDLADMAFTTQTGRSVFEHRRTVVCRDRMEAVQALENLDAQKVFSHVQKAASRSVVFMFPGGGAQYLNMAAGLYKAEPVFRQELDRCAELLKPEMGADLRSYIYPDADSPNAAFYMRQTSIGLPALFVIEYATARLLMHWGIQPDALIGHSLGEYVAACLAGVFSLQDALSLVLTRSRLLQRVPKGAMLSIPLGKEDLQPLLNERLWVAAVNGPAQSVISGTLEAVDELAGCLEKSEIDFSRIPIEVSSHSGIVEPILPPLLDFLRTIELHPPQLPLISNVTGTWILPEEAMDPQYWVRHLRNTVLFSDGVAELCKTPNRVFLEAGPGHTLATLVRAQAPAGNGTVVTTSLRHTFDKKSDCEVMLGTLGKLWSFGVVPDWRAFYANESRSRVPLPAYPFERKRYWIDAQNTSERGPVRGTGKEFDSDQWFYVPVWKGAALPATAGRNGPFLVFAGNEGIGLALAGHLQRLGQEVITVLPGREFRQSSGNRYELDAAKPAQYALLLDALLEAGTFPQTVIHAWSVDERSVDEPRADEQSVGGELLASWQADQNRGRERGFYSVLFLLQAMQSIEVTGPARLCVVTDKSQAAESADTALPEKALLAGLCKVAAQECEQMECALIDLDCSTPREAGAQAAMLLREVLAKNPEPVVALRAGRRWVQQYERAALLPEDENSHALREGGVYLITGGLGNIGLKLAEHLFRTKKARLVLTTRHELPPRAGWEQWLRENDDGAMAAPLRKLLELEAEGAEVQVLCAAISAPVQLQRVRMEAQQRFGAVNGIFHLAGKTGKEVVQLISSITPAESEEHFSAKLDATRALREVFGPDHPDFVLLFSSNASILGGMGLASYAAANSALDAFAQSGQAPGKTRWISVNWDRWGAEERPGQPAGELDAYAMTIPEALAALEKIISAGCAGQVIVSTGDLSARLKAWLGSGQQREADRFSAIEEAAVHSRPELETDYVPPRDEVEQKIAGVWKELLGLDRIGRHDNFFELGGNSLIALKAASRLNKELGTKLPVVMLFEGPTVSALAGLIAGAGNAQDNLDESENRGSRRRQMQASTMAVQ